MDSSRSEVVVVYLHDYLRMADKEVWYRVELPMTTNGNDKLPSPNNNNKKKRKRKHHVYPVQHPSLNVYPVGKLYMSRHGYSGSWAVIGDDIYWIGGFYNLKFQLRRFSCKAMLKHSIHHSDPTYWKEVSSSMNIRRISPFLAVLGNGTGKKNQQQQLCVVSGSETEYRSMLDAPNANTNPLKQCGEIYNIKKKTWELIDVDYNDIRRHNTFNEIAQDVDKPTEIVFYNLGCGSIVILDLTNNSKGPVLHPAGFDLLMHKLPPKGLIDVEDVSMLKLVATNVPAVLAGGTFYWCTHVHLRLYGYDTKEEKWLRSPSLKNHFPKTYFDNDAPQYPILLALGNGKFVLVLAIRPGHSIIALINLDKRVDKRGNSLSVSVDQFQHVYFDEDNFLPFDAKAMLKNTGSGSMH